MPVLRALAAQPRLLDAAERRHLGRDQAGVDADDARTRAPRRRARCGRCRGCRSSAARPNSVSLASARRASSSVSKRNSGATGPKVSSRAISMLGGARRPARSARRTGRRARARLPPASTLARPWRTASAHVAPRPSSTALGVDQRALRRRRLEAVADLRARCDLGHQLLRRRRRRRRPARRCGWRRRRSGRCCGTCEAIAPSTAASRSASSNTMNGRVAAELERELLDACRRALLHQQRPTSVEPVKLSLRTSRACAVSSPPISRRRAGDDVEARPSGTPARVGQLGRAPAR